MAWKPVKQANQQQSNQTISEQQAQMAQGATGSAQDQLEATGSAGAVTHQPETSAQPAPTPAPSPMNLSEILEGLSPQQLDKLRSLASSKGLTPLIGDTGAIALDGSLTVSVRLEADTVTQLENWREASDLTLADTASRYIKEALINYLYGQWPSIEQTAPIDKSAGAVK